VTQVSGFTSQVSILTIWLLRLALGGIFLAAAYYKVLDPAAFALNIFHYHLAPGAMINASALLLPWFEVVTGIAVIAAPRYRLGAAWSILIMLVVFTAAVAISVARGLDITCGCFSADGSGQRVGLMKIAENTAMIIGAAVLVWMERRAARS
jgi:uncharacterized membrane protein YphA (DoxX/SURF4 family)